MKELIKRFLEHLRIERNASDHTIRSYASDLGQFRDFLWSAGFHQDEEKGDVRVEAIDPLAIRAFLSHLYRVIKKSSLARKLAAQRSFFRYLVDEGVLKRSPAEMISRTAKAISAMARALRSRWDTEAKAPRVTELSVPARSSRED